MEPRALAEEEREEAGAEEAEEEEQEETEAAGLANVMMSSTWPRSPPAYDSRKPDEMEGGF